MKKTTLLLLLIAACDPGCTDGGDGFEWQGEHVTVLGYGYAESDACAGSLVALDERISRVMSFLGVEPPQQYRFSWVSDDVWNESPFCRPPTFACSYHEKAWSRRLPDMHEAVHMVTSSATEDRCPPLLAEGLAEYLDDPRFSRVRPTDGLGLVELIEAHPLPQANGVYARSMHFVSYLVETYGPERIIDLCDAIPREDTIADWEAAVPEVLGTTFTDLRYEYESFYPLCTSDQMRARLWGCAGTPDFVLISGDPQRSTYRLDTGCDDDRTTNAARGFTSGAATTRLIYSSEDNWFTIRARADGPSGHAALFAIQQCASCVDDPISILAGDPGWLNFKDAYYVKAGLYEVTLFFDPRDRAELEITVGYPS